MAHLTQEQRYTIASLKQENHSVTAIALRIGKHKSVVSRELKRNSDSRNGSYKASLAQYKCDKRKYRKGLVRFTADICLRVESLLRKGYSPEQVVGWCKKENLTCVSVERIYQHIWQDKKKKGDLHTYLRNKGRKYRRRKLAKDSRGVLKGRVDISERPPIVEERSRFGDIELDTIVGKDHQGGLVSMNDRMTGLIKLAKITAKDAIQVKEKIVEALQPWKDMLHTATSDNGKEFALHKEISTALGIDFYFAKPHHPWERGSNENCNRLVRQYFPKGTDFSTITDQHIQEIEDKINDRPRKRHNYFSPNEVFNQKVAFAT
jgi:transposase, IS30 family